MTEWAGRRVLVTGATGFIGSHLAQRLVDEGARVRVLVRRPAGLIHSLRDRVEIVSGDLLQPDRFVAATAACEVVFHVAGWLGRPPARPVAHAINVTATQQLAQAARAAGVRRFVYTSSIAVYGPLAGGVITEDQPHWPVYTYAETKSLGEQAALRCATADFEVTILRPAMVFGPRGSAWTVLPVRLAQRHLPVLIGGGHGFSHPVYVDNLIDAYLLAAVCPAAAGRAFTLSDGDIEWRDFFGRYAAMAGRRAYSVPVALLRLAAPPIELLTRLLGRPAVVSHHSIGFLTGRARLSTDLARQLLGWSPRVPFDEALRRTEHWLRQTGVIRAA